MKRVLFIILLFAGMGAVKAQILKPVKWSFMAVPVKGKAGMRPLMLPEELWLP